MKKSSLLRMISFADKYKVFFVLSVLCAFINVACQVSAPFIVGKAVNLMVGAGQVDVDKALRYALLLGCLYCIGAIASWGATAMTHVLMHGTMKRIRNSIFEKINRLPVSYLDGCSRGEIVSIVINDVDAVGEGLIHAYLQLFTGVGTIIGTIAFMFIVNVYVALFVVFVTPISVLITTVIAKRGQVYFARQQASLGELTGYVKEYVGGQREVRVFGKSNDVLHDFEQMNRQLQSTMQTAHFYSALPNPTARTVNNVCYIMSAVFGIMLKLSVGDISSFLMYTNHYTRPFNDITTVITQLQAAIASADRVMALLDEEEQSPDAGLAEMPPLKGDVRFENVGFSYLPDKPLIENFNCSFKAGEKVAIVGATGAGKTTIVNLIMRYYDPQRGAIYFDGVNSMQCTRASLRANIGIVTQFTWLKNGTVADNLTYGNPDATREEMIEVAKAAYCHDFIMQMGGYDAVIDSERSSLSEGQRQLLSIARVMLSHPRLLVMDEATSNIDTLRENEVQKAYSKMMQGKTCFVIAHRLATIVESDKIIVMKNGNIVEVGTHGELMSKGGYYKELFNAQFA